ncbi:hypothetical protein [Cytobacillus citreus]|nr:hypothetical protein [Cytobacillus citreus]
MSVFFLALSAMIISIIVGTALLIGGDYAVELSQSLWSKEPPFAEWRATINRIKKNLLYNYVACKQASMTLLYRRFFMVNCRKILELYFEGVSQRTISSSTGHSRNTVSDVVQRAKKFGVESLNDTMTNPWLEAFLFPEKQAV